MGGNEYLIALRIREDFLNISVMEENTKGKIERLTHKNIKLTHGKIIGNFRWQAQAEKISIFLKRQRHGQYFCWIRRS